MKKAIELAPSPNVADSFNPVVKDWRRQKEMGRSETRGVGHAF